jgi:hypothetical protein
MPLWLDRGHDGMDCKIKVELWVPQRGCVMFRCEVPPVERWTFLVEREALEHLAGEERVDPLAVFDCFRAAIYSAAQERMMLGSPEAQHILSAPEILRFAAK